MLKISSTENCKISLKIIHDAEEEKCMKMFKALSKVTCLFMVLIMLFTACGSNNTASPGSRADTESKKPADAEKIVFASVGWGEQARDQEAVTNRLKELTREKINVEADIMIISISTYAQQLNVMMAGGEDLDLFFIPFDVSVNSMINQNQLMPLNDLLASEGQAITGSLGNLIQYGNFKGKTYAIPFNGSKVYPTTIAMREDLLEKYHLNLDDVKSYKDLAKIFEVIKENESGMVCIAPNSGSLLGGYSMGDKIGKLDMLGDCIGVLLGNDNYKLENLYATEEYKDLVYTMREWYQKGYILKDAATTTESGSVMYNEGKVFSYFYIDILDTIDKAYHHAGVTQQGQQTMVKALNRPIISSATGFYSTGISSQSKHPEAAMKWFNLMYKDAETVNTLYWGIEGTNFVKEADGTISFTPEEAANRGYDLPFNWMFGNTELQYTFKDTGHSADYFAQRVKQNESAEISNAFGFSFDMAPVQSQYTAVANVVSQYQRALECGSVDPAVELPNFIQKLKEAGIDEVIAEKQTQLNAWAAEKK